MNKITLLSNYHCKNSTFTSNSYHLFPSQIQTTTATPKNCTPTKKVQALPVVTAPVDDRLGVSSAGKAEPRRGLFLARRRGGDRSTATAALARQSSLDQLHSREYIPRARAARDESETRPRPHPRPLRILRGGPRTFSPRPRNCAFFSRSPPPFSSRAGAAPAISLSSDADASNPARN